MNELKMQLLEKYKYKFELHAHTNPVSPCSQIPAEEFAAKFIDNGYDGVVVTNHFLPWMKEKYSAKEYADYYLSDFETVKKTAGDKLTVCLGMEIRFSENDNDYLVYGIDGADVEKCWYYLDKGIDCFYREFKNDRNVIFQAHPFRDGMTRCNPKSVDGVEVFNMHAGHNSRISTAAVYAKENNLLVSGGLDYHHEWQTAQTAVRFPEKITNSYDIAEFLKRRDMIFTVGDSIILP